MPSKDRSPSAISRIGPVDVPMARDRRVPPILARREHEPADHALAALEGAVEDVDAHPLWRLDGRARIAELLAPRVAEGALPEPGAAGGDVEVAREPREVLQRR